MDDEIKIRVTDIIYALKKNWKLILATSIAGMVFGLVLTVMSYMQSTVATFKINGSLAISSINELGYFTTNTVSATKDDYYLAQNMVEGIRYVMNSRLVIRNVIDQEKLIGIEPSDISRNVSISQYGDTQILDMTLIWRSPEEGVDIWNAIVNTANQYIPKILQLGTLIMINEPVASQMGVTRAGPKLAVLVSGLGFMAGVGFALISMLLHPTLNNLKDVDTVLELETLGTIPQSLTWSEQKGNIMSRIDTEVVESYSAAAYILRNRIGTKEKHHCFYITSTTSKEGKSVVAANIAIQLSTMECHTLLVDFDSRNPDIGAMFLPEVDYASSLNALYRGEANEYDVITHINGYLDLMVMIPEHHPIPLDGSIEDLFSGLMEKYEYMVINASPVGIASETLSLNQVSNIALFVIGFDSASMSEIQASIQKMDKSGTRVIGCIVNGVKGKPTGDSFGDLLPSFLKNNTSKASSPSRQKRTQKDGEEAESFEEMMRDMEVPSESRQERKKEKPRKRIWEKKKRGKDTDEANDLVTTQTEEPSAPRNLMEELIQDAAEKKENSDEDALSQLLEIGSKKPDDTDKPQS